MSKIVTVFVIFWYFLRNFLQVWGPVTPKQMALRCWETVSDTPTIWKISPSGAKGRGPPAGPPHPPNQETFYKAFLGNSAPPSPAFLAPSAPENTFHKISMRLHLFPEISYFPVNSYFYLPIFASLIIHSVKIKNPSTHAWPTVKLTKQAGVWGRTPPSSPLISLAVLNRLSQF